MKWYKFNVDAFLDLSTDLTNDEELALRRLRDAYYLTEEPLENNADLLVSIAGVPIENVEYVLDKFFKLKAQRWHDAQIDDAIARHRRQVEINTAIGKKGGRPKSTKKAELR